MKIHTHEEDIKKQEGTRYYVYEHYADGELFYVGKGCDWRWKDSTGRNDEWFKVAEAADRVEAKRIAWRESEVDALNMERQTYLSYIQEGITTLTNAAAPTGSTSPVIKEVKVQDTDTIAKLLAEVDSLKAEVEKWKERAEKKRKFLSNANENILKIQRHRSFLLDELMDVKKELKELKSDA